MIDSALTALKPLGIQNVSWQTDGEGLNMGLSDIVMLPQDMAKFGFLYLNEGQWDGKQIISAEWVRDSQQPHWNIFLYAPGRDYFGYIPVAFKLNWQHGSLPGWFLFLQ